MMLRELSLPAFGKADLSNCEQEQIHLTGSIQPHGALLVVRESDYVIVQASRNASEFLHLNGDIIDRPLGELEGDLARCIRPHLDDPLHEIPTAVRCHLGSPADTFDGLLHRPSAGELVIELERAGPAVNLSRHVEGALRKILAASSLPALCDETARLFKDLTGFDRVMVYRFDDEGHGEVYSEQREAGLEPYLGNHYPSSDIPQIARQLYIRNRVRVLVDVEYEPVPLIPNRTSGSDRELDMSLCFLRSMSPIHIQYLKNMGVAATLVTSLVVGGKLWGLIACHHYSPRIIHYETRSVCELLSEAIATRIAALESFFQSQAELSVRRLEQRMIEAISRDGDWRSALFESSQSLLTPLDATGAALLFEDQILTTGEVPGTPMLRDIGKWLDQQQESPNPVFATATLGLDEAAFANLGAIASGLLATAISNSPGEYLIWFRPERIHTVTWGGNPFKPVVIGNNPSDLSPRRSFSKWHQQVEGTSESWTAADLTAARLIGESIADVIHQFRSVRMLIARTQLEHVSRQVSQSEQPVIIADANGSILLANNSFEQLADSSQRAMQSIEDLPLLFTEPGTVRQNLRELLRHRRPWRGEIDLETENGTSKPLLVRADPVFSSPEKVLGFVLLFTDLSERKAAEAARRKFQEGIVERHRVMNVKLDSKADLMYRNLLSSVVDNAQLAALEITDGLDLTHIPEMLESVQVSIARSSELLEHLVWHATKSDDDT